MSPGIVEIIDNTEKNLEE